MPPVFGIGPKTAPQSAKNHRAGDDLKTAPAGVLQKLITF